MSDPTQESERARGDESPEGGSASGKAEDGTGLGVTAMFMALFGGVLIVAGIGILMQLIALVLAIISLNRKTGLRGPAIIAILVDVATLVFFVSLFLSLLYELERQSISLEPDPALTASICATATRGSGTGPVPVGAEAADHGRCGEGGAPAQVDLAAGCEPAQAGHRFLRLPAGWCAATTGCGWQLPQYCKAEVAAQVRSAGRV